MIKYVNNQKQFIEARLNKQKIAENDELKIIFQHIYLK